MSTDSSQKMRRDLKAQYTALSDYDIADLHSVGRTAFTSDVVWDVICEEFERRNLGGTETAVVVEERRALERHQAGESVDRVTFPERLAQGGLDMVCALFSGWVMGFVLQVAGVPESIVIVSVPFGFFAYQPFFEIRSQATPVMRLFHLKVVTKSGGRPSPTALVMRSLLRPLGLAGLLWYAIARTWWGHDALTRTRLVRSRVSEA